MEWSTLLWCEKWKRNWKAHFSKQQQLSYLEGSNLKIHPCFLSFKHTTLCFSEKLHLLRFLTSAQVIYWLLVSLETTDSSHSSSSWQRWWHCARPRLVQPSLHPRTRENTQIPEQQMLMGSNNAPADIHVNRTIKLMSQNSRLGADGHNREVGDGPVWLLNVEQLHYCTKCSIFTLMCHCD